MRVDERERGKYRVSWFVGHEGFFFTKVSEEKMILKSVIIKIKLGLMLNELAFYPVKYVATILFWNWNETENAAPSTFLK